MRPVMVVAGLLLCWVIVEDLRSFRIRNPVVIALVGCFVAYATARGQPASLLSHGVLALLGLCVLGVCFALRTIGGGDAKLLSAALFWVGPEGLEVFALALLACATLSLAGAWAGLVPARRRDGRTYIPYGPSIAAAWLIYIAANAWAGNEPASKAESPARRAGATTAAPSLDLTNEAAGCLYAETKHKFQSNS